MDAGFVNRVMVLKIDSLVCRLVPRCGMVNEQAATTVPSHNEGFPENMQDANDMVEPVLPQLRILDALYPGDTSFSDALSGGVTCVQSLPGSGNVIGGQGMVVKTKPDIVERMAVLGKQLSTAAWRRCLLEISSLHPRLRGFFLFL